MIIRSGWGILIPLVFALPYFIITMLSAVISGKANMPILFPLGSMLGAAAGWYALRKLHQYWENIPGHHVIDKNTGEELVYRKRHTLFFMGTKIRLYILGAVAIAIVVGGLMGLYALIVGK